MGKTTSGVVLLSGLAVALIGGGIVGSANTAMSTPNNDWFYEVLNGVGIVFVLGGIAMFFFGAMHFSRGK